MLFFLMAWPPKSECSKKWISIGIFSWKEEQWQQRWLSGSSTVCKAKWRMYDVNMTKCWAADQDQLLWTLTDFVKRWLSTSFYYWFPTRKEVFSVTSILFQRCSYSLFHTHVHKTYKIKEWKCKVTNPNIEKAPKIYIWNLSSVQLQSKTN